MLALTGAVLFLPIPVWSAGLTARTALTLNEDDSHFFGSRSAEEMSIEGLHAFIDQYANTAVSQLFLCPNAMKASYRSKVRDVWPNSFRAKKHRWPCSQYYGDRTQRWLRRGND